MKKIIVKKNSNDTYLIYVVYDNINIACEIANNEKERVIAVNTFLLTYFPNCTKDDVKYIVKENNNVVNKIKKWKTTNH
jgi:hypothetical protein